MGGPADLAGRLAGAILAAALGLAGYWSVRLSWADWLDRQGWPEAVRHASELAPDRADLRARLEDWAGAVARNPYDARSWIRLGLEAEARGDQDLGESCLLWAAEVDRLFEPRWTLANYYYRREAWEPFWIWARRAAELSRETPVALYRLSREVTPDLGLIFDRLVSGYPRLVEGFLYWAQTQGDVRGLQAVAEKAVELAGPDQSRALVACSSQILAQGHAGEALRLWNRMIDRRLLPFERLDPGAGASLTNGDLRLPPAGETFNWALPAVQGVSGHHAGGVLRFEFSGRQPERCELLVENVPVLGGRRYQLRSRYRTSGIASGAGPRWTAGGQTAGTPLAAEDWTESSPEFETPPAAAVIRLALVYERVPGTTRVTGVLWLAEVRLELLR
jgi:hypothetical protein